MTERRSGVDRRAIPSPGRRGRPREVDRPVRVSVRLSESTYDALDQIARQEGTSIPSLLRAGAISALKNRRSSGSFVL